MPATITTCDLMLSPGARTIVALLILSAYCLSTGFHGFRGQVPNYVLERPAYAAVYFRSKSAHRYMGPQAFLNCLSIVLAFVASLFF